MQPADIGRLVTVTDPKVSPDGRWVAFVVTHVVLEANRYRSAVWLAAVDGPTTPYPLTVGEHRDGDPAWSPDGRTLAVTAARSEDWDLELVDDVHLVDVDEVDGVPRPLTDRGLSHRLPAFGPEGTLIAALAEDSRVLHSHARVVVLDTRTGEERVLTAGLDRQCAPLPGARAPIWDGEHVLFSLEDRGNVEVWRVRADGSGAPEPVVTGTRVVTGFDAAVPAVRPEHFTVASPAGDGEIDAWLAHPAGPPSRVSGCRSCCPSTVGRRRSTATRGSTSSSSGRVRATPSSTATRTARAAAPRRGRARSGPRRHPRRPAPGGVASTPRTCWPCSTPRSTVTRRWTPSASACSVAPTAGT